MINPDEMTGKTPGTVGGESDPTPDEFSPIVIQEQAVKSEFSIEDIALFFPIQASGDIVNSRKPALPIKPWGINE